MVYETPVISRSARHPDFRASAIHIGVKVKNGTFRRLYLLLDADEVEAELDLVCNKDRALYPTLPVSAFALLGSRRVKAILTRSEYGVLTSALAGGHETQNAPA